MSEVNLLKRYPKTNREKIIEDRKEISDYEKKLAMEFNYEYFDGPRRLGLGGYKYIDGYWSNVIDDFVDFYKLDHNSSLLDVGCGKGFTLFDFCKKIPQIRIRGLEISQYCINNSLPVIRPHIDLGCCSSLPYDSNTFDLAISIATIHNLDKDGVKRSLKELIRVSKRSYIKVNGFSSELDNKKLNNWNLVAKTILHINEWQELFDEVGYDREWEFFQP